MTSELPGPLVCDAAGGVGRPKENASTPKAISQNAMRCRDMGDLRGRGNVANGNAAKPCAWPRTHTVYPGDRTEQSSGHTIAPAAIGRPSEIAGSKSSWTRE